MMILPRMAAGLWGLGFFFALGFGVIPDVAIERLAAVLCALSGAGLLVFSPEESGETLAGRSLSAPGLSFVIFVFLVLVFLSALWSVSPGISLLYGGIFSVMPVSFLAIMFAPDKARDIFFRFVLYTAGAMIASLALWALIQFFCLPAYLVNGQVRDPFANPNAFAGLMTLSILIGVGLYLNASAGRLRLIVLVGLVLCGGALAALSSQAATLTLAGGLVVAGLFAGPRLSLKDLWPLAVVAGVVVLINAVMNVMPSREVDIVDRLSALMAGDAPTWDNRVDIWRATVALILQHPFLGTGYKTFFLTYPALRPPADIFSSGIMVHSDPLQFWAELGIAGIVLFYAAAIGATLRFITWFRAGGRNVLTIFLFAGCVAFIVHTHVDFLLYTMPTMMAFVFALAMLVSRTSTDTEKKRYPLSFALTLPVQAQYGLILLPLGVILFFFVPLIVSEYYTVRASQMVLRGDMDGFSKTVNAANRIGMGLNARPYAMALSVPLGILNVRYPALPVEEQKQLFHQADALIRAGLRQNSLNAGLYYQRADLVNHVLPNVVPEGYPTAEMSLRRALAINPLHLPSRQALADSLLAQGKGEEAMAMLAAGLGWPYALYDPQGYFNQTINLAARLGKGDIITSAQNARQSHNNRVAGLKSWQAAKQAAKAELLFLP